MSDGFTSIPAVTFALRLLLSPLLIGAASLAARQWGPEAGGLLAALPLTSGPTVLLLALEHGAPFAAKACIGIELAIVSLAAYVVCYTWTSRRGGWTVSATLACAVYLACTWAFGRVTASLGASVVVALVAIAWTGRLLPRERHASARSSPPPWDIPVRMVIAAVVVWGLTRAAAIVGPRVSGLLAPFPVAVTIMAAFTHHHEGAEAARRFLRALLTGLLSFAVFFLAVGALLPRLGVARAFVAATLGALLTHVAALTITRREQRWRDAGRFPGRSSPAGTRSEYIRMSPASSMAPLPRTFTHRHLMTDALLYIDGSWREGARGRFAGVHDPATTCVVGRVAHAERADIDAAVEAAARAAASWRCTDVHRRAEILRAAAMLIAEREETIALALTTEQGKTLAESRAEVLRAVETLAWHADAAPKVCAPRQAAGDTSVRPEPIGTVAAFTPWNYPAVIIARKLAAALAAGCPVVLKAAEETPTVAVMLVAALADAGAPPGVVNLLFGDPPAISERLIGAPGVRALSFTGSTAVGKALAARAAGSLTRCVLELGGHAPVLVFDDADIEGAARAVAAYKFECAGQSCNAPSRIYVQAPVHERFVEALVEIARAIRVGDGRDAGTDMGPLANPRRLAAMERLMADARAHGARVRCGGMRLDRPGWFWSPTVLTDLGEGAALASEEPFGPIVPVWPFRTLEEGVQRANANAYGLAGYVFTERDDIAAAVAAALETGSVGINALRGVPPDVGIAGVKDSGHGHEGGVSGIEAFLNLKVVRTR